MAGYAVVIGGRVEEIHYILPPRWKNVSNLNALEGDRDSLIKLGWYSLYDNTPSYNPETHNLTPTYIIHSDCVEKSGVVTPK